MNGNVSCVTKHSWILNWIIHNLLCFYSFAGLIFGQIIETVYTSSLKIQLMKQFYLKAIRFLLIFFITADPITDLWMLVQIVVLTDMWMWIMLVIAFLCPGCFSHSYYLLCSIWLLPSTKVLTFCSDVIMQLPWRLSYKLLPYSALSTLLVVLTPLRDPVYDYIAKRLWLV